MERQFGADFSAVRVHTDAAAGEAAARLGARAFTTGQHIYFGDRHYEPHTAEGAALIAHELTHTLQQRETSSLPVQQSSQVARQDDPLEREAHVAARQVADGQAVASQVSARKTRQVQCSFLGDAWDAAKDTASGAWDSVKSGASAAWDATKDAGSWAWQKAKEGGAAAWQAGTGAVSGVGNWAKGKVESLVDGAVDLALSVTNPVKLRADFNELLGRINGLRVRVQGLGKVHLSDALWATLSGVLLALPQSLPFAVPALGPATTALFGSVEPAGSVLLAAEAIGIVLGALAEAALLALWYLGLLLLALMLLYLAYLAIKAVVEAIADAIERMRHMPPIFWSMSLPLPGPLGMGMIRTKPPNPRIPGGGQDTVRAGIPPALRPFIVAHHVLPLFLGGTDVVSNVMPIPRSNHIVGHASLQVQPHMAIWGYPINIYSHPPPPAYFLAGVKAP